MTRSLPAKLSAVVGGLLGTRNAVLRRGGGTKSLQPAQRNATPFSYPKMAPGDGSLLLRYRFRLFILNSDNPAPSRPGEGILLPRFPDVSESWSRR
jgi:hypothetical protein